MHILIACYAYLLNVSLNRYQSPMVLVGSIIGLLGMIYFSLVSPLALADLYIPTSSLTTLVFMGIVSWVLPRAIKAKTDVTYSGFDCLWMLLLSVWSCFSARSLFLYLTAFLIIWIVREYLAREGMSRKIERMTLLFMFFVSYIHEGKLLASYMNVYSNSMMFASVFLLYKGVENLYSQRLSTGKYLLPVAYTTILSNLCYGVKLDIRIGVIYLSILLLALLRRKTRSGLIITFTLLFLTAFNLLNPVASILFYSGLVFFHSETLTIQKYSISEFKNIIFRLPLLLTSVLFFLFLSSVQINFVAYLFLALLAMLYYAKSFKKDLQIILGNTQIGFRKYYGTAIVVLGFVLGKVTV